MTDTVATDVKLNDTVTPALARIAAGIGQTNSLLERMGKGLGDVENGAGGLKGIGREMGIVAGITTKAVDAVVALASAAGRSAVGVVEFAVQSASFKRNMIAGFELMEGSVDKARDTYDTIKRFADLTPFETGDVMTLFKSVRAVGLEMRTTEDVIAGISDVAATLQPERQKQAMESMVRALAKVQGQGKLTGEALEMINDAASGSAVNSMAVFQQVAAMKGITPDAARKLAESGGISASEGITAFLRAVQAGVDKGDALGTATKKFGVMSLEGQQSTFKSRLKSLFEDVDISPLVRIMTKVNDLLSESSPTGQSIRRFANETLGSMFATAERLLTPENIQTTLDTVRRTIETVTGAISQLWSGFSETFGGIPGLSAQATTSLTAAGGALSGSAVDWKAFGSALGSVANAIIAVVNATKALGNAFANDGLVNKAIFKIFDNIQNKLAREDRAARDERAALDAAAAAAAPAAPEFAGGPIASPASARAAGEAIASGMADGMMSGAPMVARASEALASTASDTVTTELEIHSPSRKMARHGEQVGAGMAGGIESSSPDVARAMADLVSVPARPANGNGRAGLGATIIVNVGDIHVGAGASPAMARETGAAIAVSLRDELRAALEEMAAAG